jgi:hypothetical protein
LQRTCYKLREVNYSRLDKRFKAISAWKINENNSRHCRFLS